MLVKLVALMGFKSKYLLLPSVVVSAGFIRPNDKCVPTLNPPLVPVPVPLAATLTSSNDDVLIYCVSLARTVTGAILPVTIGSTLYENTALSSF